MLKKYVTLGLFISCSIASAATPATSLPKDGLDPLTTLLVGCVRIVGAGATGCIRTTANTAAEIINTAFSTTISVGNFAYKHPYAFGGAVAVGYFAWWWNSNKKPYEVKQNVILTTPTNITQSSTTPVVRYNPDIITPEKSNATSEAEHIANNLKISKCACSAAEFFKLDHPNGVCPKTTRQ